jgi:putative heme-binding domain-containing protein
MLALIHAGGERAAVIDRVLTILGSPAEDRALRLDALRLLAVASAGWDDAPARKRASEALLAQFDSTPASDEELRRALAPALAWCGGTEVIQKLQQALAEAEGNHALELHYAGCLRAVREGWTAEQRQIMLEWSRQAAEWAGDIAPEAMADQSRKAQETYELFVSGGAPPGEPRRGRAIFEQRCASCHRFAGAGSRYAPDLTGLSARLDKTAILEAILWPSRQTPERYEALELTLDDGSTLEGMPVREDRRTLVLKTAAEPRPISLFKRRILSRRQTRRSIMPEGLLDSYDPAATAGLLAFLSGGKD